MTPAERFVPIEDAAALRRERARARELRQSGWWKRRIADGRCHYCAREVGARALTLDHLVPLIRGGRSIKANVSPACKDCNTKKRSLLPWEWDAYPLFRPRAVGGPGRWVRRSRRRAEPTLRRRGARSPPDQICLKFWALSAHALQEWNARQRYHIPPRRRA